VHFESATTTPPICSRWLWKKTYGSLLPLRPSFRGPPFKGLNVHPIISRRGPGRTTTTHISSSLIIAMRVRDVRHHRPTCRLTYLDNLRRQLSPLSNNWLPSLSVAVSWVFNYVLCCDCSSATTRRFAGPFASLRVLLSVLTDVISNLPQPSGELLLRIHSGC